jgi:hypothetical protein
LTWRASRSPPRPAPSRSSRIGRSMI